MIAFFTVKYRQLLILKIEVTKVFKFSYERRGKPIAKSEKKSWEQGNFVCKYIPFSELPL